MHVPLTYVLPIRISSPAAPEWIDYVRWLAERADVLVVDGSPAAVFADHARRLADSGATHLPPDRDLQHLINGKVAGVLSGIRRARGASVIIADDDVRYDDASLAAMARALEHADVVRPQNYFDPIPWHARLDTARQLLNRVSGGDWPGTLGVRRSMLDATRGYDGDVLFENLELVRTVKAAGGREACPLDLYVRRLPPSTRHFFSQRVRQAYDELARPARLAVWLAVLPAIAGALAGGHGAVLAVMAAGTIAAAETGRRIAGGTRVFPASASLLAPVWVCERGVCSWLALVSYVCRGGVAYRGRIVSRAATPLRELQQRFSIRGARL
jgi:hypothetical protein